MAKRKVWILFSKSEPLDGCSIEMDGCRFCFTEAYVPVEAEEFGVTSFESILSRVKQNRTQKMDFFLQTLNFLSERIFQSHLTDIGSQSNC